MKKIFLALIAVVTTSFLLTSCLDQCADGLIKLEADPPSQSIDTIDLDTLVGYTPQTKRIYFEDFTGVQCSNCPQAAEIIKDLQDKYPGRIVAMGVHGGAPSFTNPVAGKSKYNFKSQDADNIALLIKSDNSFPLGTIDRVKFDGESQIWSYRNRWPQYVDERLTETTPLAIDIRIDNYDENNLEFEVRVFYHENVPGEDHYLAIYLNEDGLYDYQKDQRLPADSGEYVTKYKHEHVFRTAVTSYDGEKLDGAYQEGSLYIRRFQVPIAQDDPDAEWRTGWKTRKMNVVAFVHKKNDEDFEVIHVTEKHVSE